MAKNVNRKLYKHKCELCGREFETNHIESRFCSRDCTNKWLGAQRRKNQVCKECGKEFYKSSKSLFCSKDCKEKWKLKKIEERKGKPRVYKDYKHICEECGKEFISHSKYTRFCSLSCSNIYVNRPKKIYRNCKYCGKAFHKNNMWGVQFCSLECNKKYYQERRENLQAIKNENWIKEHTKECEVCGKEFIAKTINTRCCSQECFNERERIRSLNYSKTKHKKKIIECKNCGTVFETEYGNKRSVFCCSECAKHYSNIIKRQKPEEKERRKLMLKKREEHINNNYVEPVNYAELYERDNGICQVCGLPVLEKGVSDYWSGSIDHIVPLSLGGEHSMSNCQITHRICNSIKLQAKDEFKINWEEKCKNSVYWNNKFSEYKSLLQNEKLSLLTHN